MTPTRGPSSSTSIQRQKHASRRQFRRPWLWIPIAAILTIVVIADRAGLLLVGNRDDMGRYHGTYATVVRVVSPHTIDIGTADPVAQKPTTRVRLIGINAPLPAGPRRDAEPGAEDAFRMTTSLVCDATVLLRLEPERTRDAFGRLLAHVELPDGRLLNSVLLEAGLARTDERSPHTRLAQYAKAQHIAQRRQRGLWGMNDSE